MDPDSPTSSFTISSLLGLEESNVDHEKLPNNVAPLRNTSKAGDTSTKNATESVIKSRERKKERNQRGSKSSYKKRYRATFDKAQIYQMERIFIMNHYPDVAARSELSKNTGLMESQVQIWFQNRRAKWRKQQRKRGGHDVPAIFGLGYPSHLLGYPSCEPWGVFPYEYYNTNFWTCAQQQVAAISSSWACTRPAKSGEEEFSRAVPLPEASDSLCSDSDEISEETRKIVEIRDDSSLQSLRLKAKEHLATVKGEPNRGTV